MIDCGRAIELSSAHLDRELAPREEAELASHLEACASCRGGLQSMRAVKHAVARLPSRSSPPGAVRAHIESLRFGEGWAAGRRRRMALVAAVGLGASLVAVSVMRRPQGLSRALANELVADHLRSVPEAMPAEVASRDRGEVARFFEGRVPFPPVVPALPGAQLLGGRLCRLAGGRVELLFYQTDGRTVSLYVLPGDGSRDGCTEARGHQVCERRLREWRLLLVGRGTEREIQRLLDQAVL